MTGFLKLETTTVNEMVATTWENARAAMTLEILMVLKKLEIVMESTSNIPDPL